MKKQGARIEMDFGEEKDSKFTLDGVSTSIEWTLKITFFNHEY